MLRKHSIQPTWWDVEKVVQPNPVSCVDKWFIYMWYNPLGGGVACKYILYTGIRNLAGGEFRISFLSIPRIVVHDRYYYSQYLFIYLSFYIYIFPFFMTNKIYVAREYFAILIFNTLTRYCDKKGNNKELNNFSHFNWFYNNIIVIFIITIIIIIIIIIINILWSLCYYYLLLVYITRSSGRG